MTAAAVPLLLLWLGGAAILFLDGRRRGVATFAVLLVVTAAAIAAWLLGGSVLAGLTEVVTGEWPAGVGIRLRTDALGGLFTVVSLLGITGALLVEWARGIESRVLPAVLVLLAAGLTGLFLTGDIFNFYVFFEISMISSFVLAAYGGGGREVRAAVVFAIVNLVGSAFFLAGVAALYRVAGTLDMQQLAEVLARRESPTLLVATLFFLALLLKLGIFPLHFWVPAVYRGARPIAAAVLAGVVANIGAYGLIRFGVELFPGALTRARPFLLPLGAASVIYGGVLAASRRMSAEVLAYSAIGQAGYVLLAVAYGGPLGVAAAVAYAVVNALNKTLLFLTGDLRGPAAAGAFALGAFSVVGVPPTAGFAGKVELFRLAAAGRSGWLFALLLVGAGLSLVYMFQAYQHTYWARGEPGRSSPAGARAAVLGLAGVVLALGLWAEPLLRAAHAAAAGLTGGPP